MKRHDYPHMRAFLKSLSRPEQEDFANRCHTTVNYLRTAMSKRAKMDAALIARLVEHSAGRIPPEEIRPDVNWSVFAAGSGQRRRKTSKRGATARLACRPDCWPLPADP